MECRGAFCKSYGVDEAASGVVEAATRVIEYREGFYKSYEVEEAASGVME